MRAITHGATDQSIELYIVDNTTGLPVTSLAYNSSGIDLWYRRNGAAVTSITEATQTASGAHSDGGFVHLSHGVYRLDPPDAAFASGVSHVTFGGTITGYTVYPVTVQLTAFDLQTATQNVNVTQLSGDSTAADNAEAFFDGTGYAGTNNVIPTVTNLTNKGDGSGFTAIPWNASWDAEVQSEVDDALIVKGLDHLVFTSVTGTDVADNSIIARMASKSATADWDSFVNTTDSLEAIRDNAASGGVAWADLVADNDDVAGSFGKAIADILVDTGTSLPDSIADVAADVANLTPVAADVVDDSRTWFATDYRARNIITVGDNFEGTLALQPDLNPGTTIFTVDSVSITGAATVTATDLSTNRAKTRAQFTVPDLTTTGTYTVVVTVTTIDGQVIPTTATLKVQ